MSNNINFEIEERDEFTLVEFTCGTLVPADLNGVNPPEVNTRKGIIISGRGPVWLYAFLTHYYHPTAWVATNDPRLGAVVVESHSPDRQTGEIITI